jgi:hypothetical protein
VTRRVVRVLPEFFILLDEQLLSERGSVTGPPAAVFAASDLLAVQVFAPGWDDVAMSIRGRADYRGSDHDAPGVVRRRSWPALATYTAWIPIQTTIDRCVTRWRAVAHDQSLGSPSGAVSKPVTNLVSRSRIRNLNEAARSSRSVARLWRPGSPGHRWAGVDAEQMHPPSRLGAGRSPTPVLTGSGCRSQTTEWSPRLLDHWCRLSANTQVSGGA